MNVTLNNIRGIEDAMTSLYISKGNYTRELHQNICRLLNANTYWNGMIMPGAIVAPKDREDFMDIISKVFKYGKKHTTILRYIDFSFIIEGLHRGAQDDLDAHAHRFNNRIIRQSTRLGAFDGSVSEYYTDKVLTLDQFIKMFGVDIPEEIEIDNPKTGEKDTYVRSVGGFVNKSYLDEHPSESQDVKRGLYNLAIPSTCLVKCDLFEFSHVFKMRNADSHAHPELRECIEKLTAQLAEGFLMPTDVMRSILNEIVN
jgi:thymidylate synthase ThyX